STRIMLLCASIIGIALCQFVISGQVASSPTTTTVEIHGQVRFVEGGAPAANVVVRLESYDSGGSITEAFTDRLGKFRFTAIPAAQYSVRVHHSGYRDAQQNIDMTTQSRGLVFLQLVREMPLTSAPLNNGSVDANVPAEAQKEFDKGISALAAG